MTTNTNAAPDNCTILPDGSAFALASYPLPKDHWLYAPREYEPGAEEPKELPHPILTHAFRAEVVAAVRYAIRGATMCGKEPDFDPDALVQNAVYALCGPFEKTVLPSAAQPPTNGGDPANPRDDSDRSYNKPVGYLPAYELSRLHSGHGAQLRSARFGPSALDGDVPVYLGSSDLALVQALIGAQRAINSMKVEAETAAQGDEQMMLDACEQISNEGLEASLAIQAALSTAAQGDALPREDFAWLVVQEACETDPADEDDPECIRILRRDLKSAVLAALLRHGAEAARAEVAPPAVAEPLTIQQVWASDEIMSANAMPMGDLLRIVRAVEAAHGIGIKKESGHG